MSLKRIDSFIPKLRRAELRTAKYLLQKFKETPYFIDTDLIKIQLSGADLGDNEFDIIEDALELYVQWKTTVIKHDEKTFRKKDAK